MKFQLRHVAFAASLVAAMVGPSQAFAWTGPLPTATAGVNPFETERERIVPLIDAHQHMMGERAMTTLSREPSPPAVSVPAAVGALLARRQSGVTAENYASVYSEQAQIFAQDQGRWWSGRDKVLDAASNSGNELAFVPTAFGAEGATGFVSGVLRKADGTETDDFTLGIVKRSDGSWRIATEMSQPLMPRIYAPSIPAERIIEVINDAGIRYATVLSLGYWFGKPSLSMSREQRIAGMRAENDWTTAETRKFPDRLIPFCGVNPLTDYALAEMERCAAIPGVRGIKFHRRNSRIDLTDPKSLAAMQDFFRAANRLHMALVIHLADDPTEWIDKVFPLAPDIPIQIAHMGNDWSIAKMFADAIEAKKPGTDNLWFDWTQAAPIEGWWGYGPSAWFNGKLTAQEKADIANTMRRLRLGRILYGTDMPLSWNATPREWWRRTILTLPLSDDEVRDIADNLPPYVPGSMRTP